MLIKRLILVVISLVIGFAATWGIVILIGTNLEQFGFYYTTFTSIAIGLAAAIWLDKFMGTDILPK